jgi:hypothetical protein
MARLLRGRFAALLDGSEGAALQAAAIWRARIHEGASDAEVSSDLAQVVAYSLAIATLRSDNVDADHDGRITLKEARDALEVSNSVLSAALGPLLDIPGLLPLLQVEVGALERLASAVNRPALLAAKDVRGEPWLWFYEDFLAVYEPAARKASGVYYTPIPVVAAQVRLTEHILRTKFGLPLGFGHKNVTTLDPATGSGTYPLAILDRAAATAKKERGDAGPRQVAPTMAKNMVAFELLPGPYAVAHLRIGQRIAEMEGTLTPDRVRVYLTNTIDEASTDAIDGTLFGPVRVLAEERRQANLVKSDEGVQVIIGNPPYRRLSADAAGGWMHAQRNGGGTTPFQDLQVAAQQAGVIFSAQASLYDLYVYFWRWAFWKAFEQNPDQSAVVSFITGATWLRGPAFIGLRALARSLADEVWVVDLGGEGRGAVTDDNVFAIQTPVAIVTLFRKGKGAKGPAKVSYQRLEGARADKFTALDNVAAPDDESDAWIAVAGTGGDPLAPGSGGADWEAMPALTDLFCLQQPGIKFNRTWPVAPDQDTLKQRWVALLADPARDVRAKKFATGASGRSIDTKVGTMSKIADLAPGAAAEPIVRHAYRSFDREWTFRDPRIANLERPALWQSLSEHQLFLNGMLTSPLGEGPALTAAIDVPDLHHFRGSFGGKDVVPLYRDAESKQPNVPAGLLEHLSNVYKRSVTVEELAAYVYALLAFPGYKEHFAIELADPGPRVPVTADVEIFDAVVQTGYWLLWLHTWTERFRDPASHRTNRLPHVDGLGWVEPVTTLPATDKQVTYDADSATIHIGDGRVVGVRPDVWDYSISGLFPVQAWIGRRTKKGIGRAATRPQPLDLIRPDHWHDEWNDELLDLLRILTATRDTEPSQGKLLARVLASDLIPADDLPAPSDAERQPPKTITNDAAALLLDGYPEAEDD